MWPLYSIDDASDRVFESSTLGVSFSPGSKNTSRGENIEDFSTLKKKWNSLRKLKS